MLRLFTKRKYAKLLKSAKAGRRLFISVVATSWTNVQNLDTANVGKGEHPNREPPHEAFLTQTACGVVVECMAFCVNAMQKEKAPRCSEARTICLRKGSDDHKFEDLRD